MTPELGDTLVRTATRLIEETAFLFVEPTSEPAPIPDCLACSLAFAASAEGRLELLAPREIAVEAAANMLGLEPGDPSASDAAEEALAELLNILAGSLVHEIFGKGVLCHLEIPRPIAPGDGGDATLRIPLVTDEGMPLELRLYLGAAS